METDGHITPAGLDAHVRAMVRWHFDPATGSPYWLRRAATLGFDPLADVQGFADLARFPAVADEWRDVPAADLIPKGCDGPFSVWETGGTTGAPRRIVDANDRYEGILRINHLLDDHGFPGGKAGGITPGRPAGRIAGADAALAAGNEAGADAALAAGNEAGTDAALAAGNDEGATRERPDGGWLHMGPSGPHLVGTSTARLAALRGALHHAVDLDPRWVKRLYREGRAEEAKAYTAHLVEQALHLLRTQPIRVITTTPPLLQALLGHSEAYGLIREKVQGIIWFGTSMAEEALRLLEEELLPETRLVGWYGNTLMGIACQRPRQAGDAYRCIFIPPSPGAVVQLVDPREPSRLADYGEAGQVRLTVLNREIFLPWHLERDQAVRVPPASPGGWDGLARVSPLEGAGPRVEGVY